MRTISIINLKGGVGKTTTALAMAHLLAEKEEKYILLIDNDKQGNLSRAMEQYRPESKDGTMSLLRREKDIKSVIRRTSYPRIDIIPCNMRMMAAEKEADEIRSYREALKEAEGYDYCIIDNAPGIGYPEVNAIMAADEIIIPLTLDRWAIDGLDVLMEQVKEIMTLNPAADLAGILITDYERTKTAEAAEETMRRTGWPIFRQKIRHSKAVTDSTIYHKPVTDYSIRCGAAQDYKKMLLEYLDREAERYGRI